MVKDDLFPAFLERSISEEHGTERTAKGRVRHTPNTNQYVETHTFNSETPAQPDTPC